MVADGEDSLEADELGERVLLERIRAEVRELDASLATVSGFGLTTADLGAIQS